MNRLKGIVILMVVSLSTVAPAQHAEKKCSTTSLKGTYTYQFQAQLAGGGTLAAAVGRITYHGNGHFTDSFTANFGSGPVAVESDGTYTVAEDCTFTSEFNGSTQFGVIAQNGDKLRVVSTDAGIFLSFTAEKERSE